MLEFRQQNARVRRSLGRVFREATFKQGPDIVRDVQLVQRRRNALVVNEVDLRQAVEDDNREGVDVPRIAERAVVVLAG